MAQPHPTRSCSVDAPVPESGAPAEHRRLLLGTVPEERIRSATVAPIGDDVVRRFLALEDMTCAVADAVDALAAGDVGVGGVRAVRPGSRACGPVVTLRYREVEPSETAGSVLGDRDLYGLAPAGGVAMIDAGGHAAHAVVGDISAAWAALAGVTAIVVDGAVRDVDTVTTGATPVWSRHIAARNARGRLDAVELNGPVVIDGARVEPGDVVVADANGIATIRRAHVHEVLDHCERAGTREAALKADLDAAVDLESFLASYRRNDR